jgi:hypothetical protein
VVGAGTLAAVLTTAGEAVVLPAADTDGDGIDAAADTVVGVIADPVATVGEPMLAAA